MKPTVNLEIYLTTMLDTYHGDLHRAIWEAIKEEYAGEDFVFRKKPSEFLIWLILKIDQCLDQSTLLDSAIGVDYGIKDWDGTPMVNFADKIRKVSKSLYEEGLLFKMTWRKMKMILEFYLNDCTGYIKWVESVKSRNRWTNIDINQFFGLGMCWFNITYTQTAWTDKVVHLNLIWTRYLTSDMRWQWSTNELPSRDSYPARGGWYVNTPNRWADNVRLSTGLLYRSKALDVSSSEEQTDDEDYPDDSTDDEDVPDDSTDDDDVPDDSTDDYSNDSTDDEPDDSIEDEPDDSTDDDDVSDTTIGLTEQQTQKNDALIKIQQIVDYVQEDIGDRLYVQLMNSLKTEYVVSS